MKNKSEAILSSCALCIHATLTPKVPDGAAPLLFALKADAMSDDVTLLCPYKKEADAAFHCRRFSFDPLKYKPKKAPSLGTLDEDALLLD